MQRSYWRALAVQLRTSLSGPVGIGSAIVGLAGITATGIYSYLGKLHGWAPVVITAAVVIVLANYVGFQGWKGHHATIDQARIEARQSPAFRAHVDDLHGWAEAACQRLEWRANRLTVDMTGPLAECFGIHYPDAAAAVGEINERVATREAIVREFNETAKTIAAMVPNRAPGLDAMIRWVGERAQGVEELDLKAGEGGSVTLFDSNFGGTFIVAQAQRREDVEATLEAVKTAATLMWQHPAAQAMRTIVDETPVRQRALNSLVGATLDHNPPHECPKCERLLSGY